MTRTVTVSTTAQLLSALSSATAGEVIKLAAGTYSNVTINNVKFASTVTITSATPGQPATLKDLKVVNCKFLAFTNLELSSAGDPVSPAGACYTAPFRISSSDNISFNALNVHGDPNGTLATDAGGLMVEDSTHIKITNSQFWHVHWGIDQVDNNAVTISGNSFHEVWDDGIRGGGTSNIQILNNSFTDFHMDPTDTDHPDAIQFWTTGTNKATTNITISGNTFTRGAGGAIQGIFMRDEDGNKPYQNVTITNNSFTGTMDNGIVVYNARNLAISNNVVNSYTDYDSQIKVLDSNKVVMTNNIAEQYSFGGDTKLTQSGDNTNNPLPLPAMTQHFSHAMAATANETSAPASAPAPAHIMPSTLAHLSLPGL